MKNIYVLFLALWLVPVFHSHSQVILTPPLNLQVFSVETEFYLTWDPPQGQGNPMPPGLLGYKVYRNNVLIEYIGDPDTTWYMDYNVDPGEYQYFVTAWYDLTPYGNPGQFGESDPSNIVNITQYCWTVLPFMEAWDQGTINYNWILSPPTSNWSVVTSSGNPAPMAVFTGNPVQTNYNFLMISMPLCGYAYLCASLRIEFDYMLDNINPTGNEKLITEVCVDSAWTPIHEISNTSSTGWTHVVIENDTLVAGTFFKIGFRTIGNNSADITRWGLDNIYVMMICSPVKYSTIGFGSEPNIVAINWIQPICPNTLNPANGPFGYNIYRSHAGGVPPYIKINPDFIEDTSYQDTVPLNQIPVSYKYYITANYNDEYGYYLCETTPSDTMSITVTDINGKESSLLSVSPNPTNGLVRIGGLDDVVSFTISDLNGRNIIEKELKISGENEVIANLSGNPPGLYFIRIQTSTRVVTGKIILSR